jgi:hypothetical protein
MATSDTPKSSSSSSSSSHSSFIITMEQLPELKFICGLFQKQSPPPSFIPSKYPQEALPSRSLNSFAVFSSESPQLPPACSDLNKPTTQEQSRITERSRSFHRTKTRSFTDSSQILQTAHRSEKVSQNQTPPEAVPFPGFGETGLSGAITHHACLLACLLASSTICSSFGSADSTPRFREAPGKTEGDLVNALDGHGNTLAFLSHHPKVPPLM